ENRRRLAGCPYAGPRRPTYLGRPSAAESSHPLLLHDGTSRQLYSRATAGARRCPCLSKTISVGPRRTSPGESGRHTVAFQPDWLADCGGIWSDCGSLERPTYGSDPLYETQVIWELASQQSGLSSAAFEIPLA